MFPSLFTKLSYYILQPFLNAYKYDQAFEIENSVSIHTAKEVKIQHALDWELLVVVEQGLSRPGKELTGGHGLRLKVTSDF